MNNLFKLFLLCLSLFLGFTVNAQEDSFERKRDSIHQLILGDWQLIEFSLKPYVDDTLNHFEPVQYKTGSKKLTFKKDEIIFYHNTCASSERFYKRRNAIVPVKYYLDSIDYYYFFNNYLDPPPFLIQTYLSKNKRKKSLLEKYDILHISPNTMVLKKYLTASYPSQTIYMVEVNEIYKRFPVDSTKSNYLYGDWYFEYDGDWKFEYSEKWKSKDTIILYKNNPFRSEFERYKFNYKENSLFASITIISGSFGVGYGPFEIVYNQDSKRIQLFGNWYSIRLNDDEDEIQLIKIP